MFKLVSVEIKLFFFTLIHMIIPLKLSSKVIIRKTCFLANFFNNTELATMILDVKRWVKYFTIIFTKDELFLQQKKSHYFLFCRYIYVGMKK